MTFKLNFISHLDPRGGTELFPVFQSALVNRRVDVTTKIFMLTDGEVRRAINSPKQRFPMGHRFIILNVPSTLSHKQFTARILFIP